MPTVSVNTQFPGYEILGELGRGNARVLKARHVASGDLVAIKQFALDTDAETLHRFQQESAIMTRINHPNVVKVREVCLESAMPYVVMEFVEGGDLRSLLKGQSRLDVSTTLRLGLQMAEALRAIHREHVIHRDIKPENILYRRLVSGELHFLLTDFGIAKIRADESTRTRTGQSLLTYEYAAPEQFDNPRQVGPAADYYALGVVLYEAVSGRVPFPIGDEAGLASFMRQVLTATPPEPSLPTGQRLPPSLSQLLRGLLIKQADERTGNVDDVELLLEQAKVEQLRANRPGSWEPQSTAIPPRPATVTRPAPVPVVAEPEYAYEPDDARTTGPGWRAFLLTLLVGGGVLAFWLFNRNSNHQPVNKVTSTITQDSTATMATDTVPASTEDSEAQIETNPATGDANESDAGTATDSTAADPTSTMPVDSTRMPPDSTQ